jgi:hypothetical protein
MKETIKEPFISFEYRRKNVDHDIYHDHKHSKGDAIDAQHKYNECMWYAKTDGDKKKCMANKIKVFDKVIKNKESTVISCLEDKINKLKNKCNSKDTCKSLKKQKSSAMQYDFNKKCKEHKQKCIDKYSNLEKNNSVEYNKLKQSCSETINGKGFFRNMIKKLINTGRFEFIYYTFTIFAILLFGSIFMAIIWRLFVLFDKVLIHNFLSKNFPGRIIFPILSTFFDKINPKLIQYVYMVGFCFFLGIVVLLYFFKKTFNWWPASMVWSAIKLFKGSDTPFRWLDSVFWCNSKSGGAFFCNSHAMWSLFENWIVDTCDADKKNCNNKSSEEIKQAFNSFRVTLDPHYININKIKENLKNEGINIEKFTNYSNNKNDEITKKSKYLVEEFYSYQDEFVSNYRSHQEEYDKEEEEGNKNKKKYDEAQEEEDEDEEED